MGKMVSGLFGGGSRQLDEMRAAQAEQQRLLSEERGKVESIEAAQKRLRLGGRRGFLAFKEAADQQLSTTFGNSVSGGGYDGSLGDVRAR